MKSDPSPQQSTSDSSPQQSTSDSSPQQSTLPQQFISDTQTVLNSTGATNPAKDVAESQVSNVISDEVLRCRIRELISEKPPLPLARRIVGHALFGVFLQFLLTGVVGVAIVASYNAQQQRIGARRSFFDELNKLRIQRVGEVWEKLDQNEFLIDRILENGSRQNNIEDKDLDEIHRLIHEDLAIISKNRFWLGDEMYQTIRTYLDLNIQYALNKLIVTAGTDLNDLTTKREKAKQDILRVRNSFLKATDNEL